MCSSGIRKETSTQFPRSRLANWRVQTVLMFHNWRGEGLAAIGWWRSPPPSKAHLRFTYYTKWTIFWRQNATLSAVTRISNLKKGIRECFDNLLNESIIITIGKKRNWESSNKDRPTLHLIILIYRWYTAQSTCRLTGILFYFYKWLCCCCSGTQPVLINYSCSIRIPRK